MRNLGDCIMNTVMQKEVEGEYSSRLEAYAARVKDREKEIERLESIVASMQIELSDVLKIVATRPFVAA